ncbi:MAG: TolC family protein [Marinifilaceae bacterium]|jgi:outer membrane protein TolC|nr:TolC family protein [Marinifilaceae bacterium]
MRIKFSLIVGILCCLFINTNAQTVRLTYEEALNMSYKNNSLFKQNDLLKQEKLQDQKATMGLFMPQLSLNANYMYMSKDLHLDLSPVRDAITPLYDVLGHYGSFTGVKGQFLIDPKTGKPTLNPRTGTPIWSDQEITAVMQGKIQEGKKAVMSANWDQMIQEKAFGTLSANLLWPIYAGGKIRAAYKASQLKVQETDIQVVRKTQEHMDELASRYFGLCLIKEVKTVREEVFKAMKNHKDDAERLYKAGMIAKVQFLHAKVFYDDAQRELKKVERQLKVVKDAVANTIGVQGIDVVPMSNLFYTEDIKTLDYYKEQAQANSPILKLVDNKKALATQNFRVQRSNMIPTVAAMGVYDIANHNLSPFLPEYMVGVGIKWNIFSGQKAFRKTKKAKLTIKRVEEVKLDYTADINTGIKKYYEELQMCLEQIKALDSSMEFAQEYYSARNKSFKEGLATSTELVDASLAVTKVRIDRLKAVHDFDICLSKLLKLAGISSNFIQIQKDVKTINEK